MKTLLAMALLCGALASPAFAQTAVGEMNCADFTAMDRSAQMAAVSSMDRHTGSGDSMSSESMMSDNMMAPDGMDGHKSAHRRSSVSAGRVAKACAGHPDMMVQDAMKQAMAH